MKIGDRVGTKHGVVGVCIGIIFRDRGYKQYEVSYCDDSGTVTSNWFQECEIDDCSEKIGFHKK